MSGAPVQCDGVLEGVLSVAHNDQCRQSIRIFVVTRFDAYYKFIYESTGYRRSYGIPDTTTPFLDEDMPQKKLPVAEAAQALIENIKISFMARFNKLIVFNYQSKHNIIWNVLPVIFKMVALVGKFGSKI